uniref:Col_cuticle_N domain-containing protein n=1 Tax=Globodera pallida TaxID=36090 RepID=A0A183BQN6_GLOPA
MPREAQLIATVAGGCCVIVLFVCLAVIPQIYWDIQRLNDEVRNGVEYFRAETDAAWDELMHVQLLGMAPTPAPEHPFTSLVGRLRRQAEQYNSLPAWCQCQPIKPQCPPGPPGPPGEPGQDGQPGHMGPLSKF